MQPGQQALFKSKEKVSAQFTLTGALPIDVLTVHPPSPPAQKAAVVNQAASQAPAHTKTHSAILTPPPDPSTMTPVSLGPHTDCLAPPDKHDSAASTGRDGRGSPTAFLFSKRSSPTV